MHGPADGADRCGQRIGRRWMPAPGNGHDRPRFNRILIACVGNICRSPMAEVVLRQKLADRGVVVESAGLAALVGRPIDPLAEAVLAEHGLTGEWHVARQLGPELLQAADLVLVMEKRHLRAIHAQSVQASGKTFLLGKWQHEIEIPDPHGQPKVAFQGVYRLVSEAADAWLDRL